ncbi:MAG TPA: translation initiation factor IF-2 N-terminal domain-containing protein, partial [Blastocatellia bacterium]|nr:translation initiation factor IF-2 N-terminal domain-containing protein [Blastocatellia bacterium]
MKRVRLYELAKELRLETRQVVADARRFGAMVSSPSSSVDERTANRIRELYFPKKAASGQPRAARLVKAHKPVEMPEGPAADRQPEGHAVQEPLPGAPKGAAMTEPPPRTESRTRIIKLTPKPAPMRTAPSTRPQARPLTEAPRSTRRVAPPAEAASPTTEAPALSGRTTYIPPRASRPIGRHGKGPHKKAERFSDGPQARAFTAERSMMATPRAASAIPAVLRPVRLMEGATVREFAERLDVKPKDV